MDPPPPNHLSGKDSASSPNKRAREEKLNSDHLLLQGAIPLSNLLDLGADLWEDDDYDEFFPMFDEDDDDGEAMDSKTPEAREKRLRGVAAAADGMPEVYDSNNESGFDDDIYARFLDPSAVGFGEDDDDDDDEDEYDFLDDVDGNVELLRKDKEDELEVGLADEDEVQYLRGEGGAAFFDVTQGRKQTKRLRPLSPMSSPAKGTRSARAQYQSRHPVLTMNVPQCELFLEASEPTAQQRQKIQMQLDSLQQLVMEGIGMANLDGNNDLLQLYRSIALELEMQFLATDFDTAIVTKTSHLKDLSQIHNAFGMQATPRILLRNVTKTSAMRQKGSKVSKKSGVFFSERQDELIAWGLGRVYAPATYDGSNFRLEKIRAHYFPLWSNVALASRVSSRSRSTATENPIKRLLRTLRTELPWSNQEHCYLIMWSRRYPGDADFVLAQTNVKESQLKHRLAEHMCEERTRLRMRYLTREAEDELLKENGVDLDAVDLDEVVVPNDFDKEEIDSSLESDEEEDLAENDLHGPGHPRGAKLVGNWRQEEDAALLGDLRAHLTHAGPPPDVLVNVLIERLARPGLEILDRFKDWQSAYRSKHWLNNK